MQPEQNSSDVASRSVSQLLPVTQEWNIGGDIIIQHRDGGSAQVQEVPPPYIDVHGGSSVSEERDESPRGD